MVEGVVWGFFPDFGPLAEDSAAKLKKSQLNVCTVYVFSVLCTLFPSAAEICARLAGNYCTVCHSWQQRSLGQMIWFGLADWAWQYGLLWCVYRFDGDTMIKLGKPRTVGLRLLYSESQTGFNSIYLFQTYEVLALSSVPLLAPPAVKSCRRTERSWAWAPRSPWRSFSSSTISEAFEDYGSSHSIQAGSR